MLHVSLVRLQAKAGIINLKNMKLKRDIQLNKHSTMKLGGPAQYLTEVKDRSEVAEAVVWAEQNKLPVVMIGNGSNIIWSDNGFKGVVIVNRIMGYDAFEEGAGDYYLTVGSGENWDSVVERSVKKGLSGIEALSLIPGTVGATPVQNVGAYGQEISTCLVSVEAYDRQTHSFVNIPKLDCHFGYRTSRFNTVDKNRFFITGLTFHLKKSKMQPPFYQSLNDYLTEHAIVDYTPEVIRKAVMEIRSSKLPDPGKIANNGSFFINPIVSAEKFQELNAKFPGIAAWDLKNGQYKISAAWLIERAGFKGVSDIETGMGIWSKQAVVLTNIKAKTTNDLLKFKQKINDRLKEMFDITLEQEPEFIGTPPKPPEPPKLV